MPRLVQQQIQQRIDTLGDDPRTPGTKALAGQRGFYRVRVGNYRVIYRIEVQRPTVLVVRIGHRREVYRRL